jgi:hypothetical protein
MTAEFPLRNDTVVLTDSEEGSDEGMIYIRGEVSNYPQCSFICGYVGSTVILRSIAMRGFCLIIYVQV